MIRRHGFAALSTALGVVAVILLAISAEHVATFVALAAIVLALVGGAFTAKHKT